MAPRPVPPPQQPPHTRAGSAAPLLFPTDAGMDGEAAYLVTELPLAAVPATDPVLADAVQAASTELGRSGRVLLRPSGTEPIVRVMVEAPTHDEAQGVASRLADVVTSQLAL